MAWTENSWFDEGSRNKSEDLPCVLGGMSLGKSSERKSGVESEEKKKKRKKEKEKERESRKELRNKYNDCVAKAKSEENGNDILQALFTYRLAFEMYFEYKGVESEQLSKRIYKLERRCENELPESEIYEKIVTKKEKFNLCKCTPRVHFYRNVITDEYHLESKYEDEEEANDYVLPSKIFNKLYEYQRDALMWFWNIHEKRMGGILGDDMGLGKTIEMSAFLKGLFYTELISTALLIVPTSVLENWHHELKKWCPDVLVLPFHSSVPKKKRLKYLKKIIKKGGILLTTYGMVRNNEETLGLSQFGADARWDYMILDEGHKIKNHNIAISKAVRNIEVNNGHKIILSGTYVQNNLTELWSIFDFISEGRLLGTLKDFNTQMAQRIERSNQKDASPMEIKLGKSMLKLLTKTIDPYIKRRTKKQIKALNDRIRELERKEAQEEEDGDADGVNHVNQSKNDDGKQLTSKKFEIVVWIKMCPVQVQLYRKFLESDQVKETLNTSKSPLAALLVLKKICDHPMLLTKSSILAIKDAIRDGAINMKKDDPNENENENENESDGMQIEDSINRAAVQAQIASDVAVVDKLYKAMENWSNDNNSIQNSNNSNNSSNSSNNSSNSNNSNNMNNINNNMNNSSNSSVNNAIRRSPNEDICSFSSKIIVCLQILSSLRFSLHRVLLFSRSKILLNWIEALVKEKEFSYLRMDGSTPVPDRQNLCNEFNNNSNIFLFMLTKGVGALGLTLTGADRVIIFDPDWNPANDSQAIDRAYRVGQMRDVLVYRLCTCGTIEEKMYQRQVSKLGLLKSLSNSESEYTSGRYFSRKELKKVFTLENSDVSETCKQFESLKHSKERNVLFDGEINGWTQTCEQVYGISYHDLLFSEEFIKKMHEKYNKEHGVENSSNESNNNDENEMEINGDGNAVTNGSNGAELDLEAIAKSFGLQPATERRKGGGRKKKIKKDVGQMLWAGEEENEGNEENNNEMDENDDEMDVKVKGRNELLEEMNRLIPQELREKEEKERELAKKMRIDKMMKTKAENRKKMFYDFNNGKSTNNNNNNSNNNSNNSLNDSFGSFEGFQTIENVNNNNNKNDNANESDVEIGMESDDNNNNNFDMNDEMREFDGMDAIDDIEHTDLQQKERNDELNNSSYNNNNNNNNNNDLNRSISRDAKDGRNVNNNMNNNDNSFDSGNKMSNNRSFNNFSHDMNGDRNNDNNNINNDAKTGMEMDDEDVDDRMDGSGSPGKKRLIEKKRRAKKRRQSLRVLFNDIENESEDSDNCNKNDDDDDKKTNDTSFNFNINNNNNNNNSSFDFEPNKKKRNSFSSDFGNFNNLNNNNMNNNSNSLHNSFNNESFNFEFGDMNEINGKHKNKKKKEKSESENEDDMEGGDSDATISDDEFLGQFDQFGAQRDGLVLNLSNIANNVSQGQEQAVIDLNNSLMAANEDENVPNFEMVCQAEEELLNKECEEELKQLNENTSPQQQAQVRRKYNRYRRKSLILDDMNDLNGMNENKDDADASNAPDDESGSETETEDENENENEFNKENIGLMNSSGVYGVKNIDKDDETEDEDDEDIDMTGNIKKRKHQFEQTPPNEKIRASSRKKKRFSISLMTKSACEYHKNVCEEKGFVCTNCCCDLSREAQLLYDKYVEEAQALFAPKTWNKALKLLMKALKICDSDPILHDQCKAIGEIMTGTSV